MPTINERLATIEERVNAVLHSIDELKNVHGDHLSRCHATMQPLIKEVDKNTMFRQISLWILTSSGVVSLILGFIWIGIKEHIRS